MTGSDTILLLMILFVLLFLPIWTIYKILKHKRMSSIEKVIWIITVFFFNIIGVIIYYIYIAGIRGDRKKSSESPKKLPKNKLSKHPIEELEGRELEQLSRNILLHAQLDDKTGLLNALENLKVFSKEHQNDIGAIISKIKIMMKKDLPIDESTTNELKILLHKIENENKKARSRKTKPPAEKPIRPIPINEENPKLAQVPEPVKGTDTSVISEYLNPNYSALAEYLKKRPEKVVQLTFSDIERIIGSKLPDSARKYQAWWANTESHSHAVKGWLQAGRRLKSVDLKNKIVIFERVEPTNPKKQTPSAASINLHRGFPPELLEKYEPLEFLGEGGFAKVFKVKRKKDGKIVALKIPRIDKKTSRTFIREVSTWLQLNHPNIVKLYDVDILPIPHLEMEYVEGVKVDGETVRDLEGYPKPVDEKLALKLIKGIAEGLNHAHSKGIYHRDLKPLNVLLKSGLTPKITDWGLAKIGTMSSSRSVMGYTPLYAAPEHLLQGKYGHTDARTDIWQLGVIFYELLTGRLPFEGYTYEEVFGKIVDETYRFTPPSKINPELAKYDGIFEKLLAKKKEDRYGSVDEFLKDLKKLGEAKERKAELEESVEELRKSLSKSVKALKQSKSAEEALRNKRTAIKTMGKLALAYAELNRKAELLNTLNDLKFYTVQNLNDLLNAINTVEALLKENLPVSEDFIGRLKVLVHDIERENGV
ncbi:serine/threonine-protein kinase [Thermococcus sp. Bubb.Bath]|uniref:serine/threonine-protein kinase n=1 Tax=Thermococcus sp. Bubb.Bath TaxID=1638242 RepID=UPI0016B0EE1F|nr:serine/threonine-protein kinase [Thermococcus sp. Bubb.Bath]NJF25685.1 serine/threonine protein kinase [Thermococcus sp. Bubb.Bath]